ncbi:MAG: Molybdate-binding protein ModA [Fimbriimonadaceae bacterium]|nr:Molybdate-binding protein ModA [Fimbriimonadaceae bacterium]
MLAVAIATCFVGSNVVVRLTVFAAASLREPITAIARSFERATADVKVLASFAGSNTLAAQINHGAPADVFASASTKNLDECKIDRSTRRIFAHNRLQVALRAGLNGIATIADLRNVKHLVVADRAVPAGAYSEAFLAKAAVRYGQGWLTKVRSNIVSREPDVKAVLAKVIVGEADGGIVYASDILSAKGKVAALDIPDSVAERIHYAVAMPASAQNKPMARRFIEFLLSHPSQQLLAGSGFIPVVNAVRKPGR